MRFSSRTFVLAVIFALSIGCYGQTSPQPRSFPAASTKRFCQQDGAFCFSYPATWSVLGEAFDNGVVVAPRQTGERSLWNVVTVVAMREVVDPGHAALSIDDLIEAALNNMRAAGHIPATLERQTRTVAGLPGQMIRLRYHDDATARDWVEQLVFVQGPEQEIYSASLKAQPPDFERLRPAFESILRSWKLQPAENSGMLFAVPPISPAPDFHSSQSYP